MATLLAIWFAISVYGYTSNNAINLFISLCLQYFFAFAAYPLYVEAAVEVTFPVPEGITIHIVNFIVLCISSLTEFGYSIVTGSSAGVMNVLTHAATLLFQVRRAIVIIMINTGTIIIYYCIRV